MDTDSVPMAIESLLLSSILTFVFVGLKLFGIISWPWLWVLSPLWIREIINVSLLVFMLLVIFVCYGVDCLVD